MGSRLAERRTVALSEKSNFEPQASSSGVLSSKLEVAVRFGSMLYLCMEAYAIRYEDVVVDLGSKN